MEITRDQLQKIIRESLMHDLALKAVPDKLKESTLTSHAVGLMIKSVMELYQALPANIYRSEKRSGFKKTDAALEVPSRLEYFASMFSMYGSDTRGTSSVGKLMTPAGRENLTKLGNLTSEVNFISVFFKIAHDPSFYLSNNRDDLIEMGEKYDDFLVTSNAHGIVPVHLFFKTIFLAAGYSKSTNVKSFTPLGFSKSFSFINRSEKELGDVFGRTLSDILLPLLGITDENLQSSELSYEQRASSGTSIDEVFEYFRRGFSTKDGLDRFKVFFKMITSLTPDQVAKEMYNNTDGIEKIINVNIRFFVEMIGDYNEFVIEYRDEIDDQLYHSYMYHADHLVNAAENSSVIMKYHNGSYSSFLGN